MAEDRTQWYASLTKLNLWQMIKNSSLDVQHQIFKMLPRFQSILKDYKNSVFNISLHRLGRVINQESDYQNSTTFKSVPASVFVIIWRRASSNWLPLMLLKLPNWTRCWGPKKWVTITQICFPLKSCLELQIQVECSACFGVSGKQSGQKDFWGFPLKAQSAPWHGPCAPKLMNPSPHRNKHHISVMMMMMTSWACDYFFS